MLSDHALVVTHLLAPVEKQLLVERMVRGWRKVDRNVLKAMLEESEMLSVCADENDDDVDTLFGRYQTTMLSIVDKLAPQHTLRRHQSRLSPWFDDECRQVRRKCRQLERLYRRTGDAKDRRAWVDATRSRFVLYRQKKEELWLRRLQSCGRSSTRIWRTMSPLLDRSRDVGSSATHTAEGFLLILQSED